ncbi:MAG: patatin-like phospholipase family protein [Spirochaetales bacterium]|nr:patatin-like phospholipase family protein [Spirochaetales bacterium]MCF7937428.1 patatin-like phospholipase family protein [Spirochaetales bacterium]
MSTKRKKLGLALGGGAARGLAHIGVLKALEEAGLEADYVAGTSAGSLIGVYYAAGYKWRSIYEIAKDITWANLIRPAIPSLGLVKAGRMEALLENDIGGLDIQDLLKPFRAVTVDIISGEQVVADSGDAARIVRASCSIPGIFPPVWVNGRMLVDGGLRNNVPEDIVYSMGADVVLSVNLNADRSRTKPPESLLSVLYYSFGILMDNISMKDPDPCTFRIEPELSDYGYQDLKHKEELISRGEAAALPVLVDLKELLEGKKRCGKFSPFFRLFGSPSRK